MRDDKLSVQSMDFAESIINLVKELKLKKESTISNQKRNINWCKYKRSTICTW